MKKKHAISVLIVLLGFCAFSQSLKYKPTKEIGFMGGVSFYRGDLNNFSHLYKYINPSGGIFFRKNFNPRFSLRFNALYGKLHADDAKSNSLLQQQRNLSFRSNVFEGSAQLEFNYLDFKLGSDKSYPASTYLFLGMGAFYFNPQANFGGSWVNLQPLGTEGQGTALSSNKKYNRIQPCLPMGIGLKMDLGGKTCLGFEFGMRKTFTDYIDDVSTVYVDPVQLAAVNGSTAADLADRSNYTDPTLNNIGRQRGNSKNKDWYGFAGITLSFKFREKPDPCPSYN